MARIGWISAAAVACAGIGLGLASAGVPEPVGVGLGVMAAVGLVAAVSAGSATPSWQMFGPAVLHGPRDAAAVALTFDDGPDPASTEQLVSALDAVGARATFFVVLENARKYPALLRRMAERHEIGLHAITHDTSLVWMHPRDGSVALREAAQELSELAGVPVTLFRPPFGVTGPRLMQSVEQSGLTTIWCSLRTFDGVGSTPEALLERCQAVTRGDILLMHEGERPAREALPTLLERLKSAALECVTVSSLVGR